MTREDAMREIRTRISCKPYLERSKSGLYCCPFCGSGKGANGTGALKLYDSNTWTCHACHKSGDVIDLYQQATGADFPTAISLLAQEAGISIDSYHPTAAADFSNQGKNDLRESPQRNEQQTGNAGALPGTKTPQEAAERPTAAPADYSAYYAICRERLQLTAEGKPGRDYLKRRGISPETAAAYFIGFDPAADPASAPGEIDTRAKRLHPCPRIIIPTSAGHYIGRSIDPDTPKAFSKLNPNTEKGAGSPAIFNAGVLNAEEVREIFVTEGAIDALSIIEAGAPAIALNSAANVTTLLKQLEARRTAATMLLCLDNDTAGAKATDALKAGLQRLNISYATVDLCGGRKDPNEALTADRQAFFAAVEQARQRVSKPDNTAYYLDALMSGEIERFRNDRKTGFSNLDRQAGGLYAGLYVLAAISSLGKTSFALQLADQLAERGNDVLFFSLEQSRLELVSKSLARRTAQADPAHAVSSLSIRSGALYPQVLQAVKDYKDAVADRMSIIEGNFSCDISFIGSYIRQYVQRTGIRPVIFIDYLQILQPAEENRRQTTKESIDNAVTQLKRISRELELTVFVISSVNRNNYLTPIDFESLKESGGIEYTCDVVWGLQLQCLNEDLFSKKESIKEKRERIKAAKAENPRKIELCCLKNRYGIANYSCYFDYFPENDLFTESREFAPQTQPERKAGATRL